MALKQMPQPSVWTLIATATPSGASTLSFTSIPAIYTQLRVVHDSVTQNSSTGYWSVRLNNDSGGNYSWHAARNQGNNIAAGYNAGATAFGNSVGDAVVTQVQSNNATEQGFGFFQVERASSSGDHVCTWGSFGVVSTIYGGAYHAVGCYVGTAAAVTQIDFIRSSTQTITGNFYLYGMA